MSDKAIVFLRILLISIVYALNFLASTWMFVNSLEKRSNFIRRLAICLSCYFAFSVALAGIAYGIFISIYDWMYYGGYLMIVYTVMLTLMSVIYLILTYFFFYFLYDSSRSQMLYCIIAGYATWRFASSAYTLLIESIGMESLFMMSVFTPAQIAIKISIYVAVQLASYLVIWLVFSKKFKIVASDFDNRLNSYTMFLLLSMIAVSLLCGCVSETFQGRVEALDICLQVTQIVFSIIMLFIQCFLMAWVRAERENEVISTLRKQSDEQMEMSKKNIEIINIKVHDLKKELSGINLGDDKFLDETKKAIGIYDTMFSTGNETLDVILTDKAFRSKERNIRFYVMVDGKALSFLSPSDINSIFGNAIDNAIECEEGVEDLEKRYVSVLTSTKGDMVAISIENHCPSRTRFGTNNLPLTNKDDKNYHGYGTLSMKRTVESYGGSISFKQEKDVFKVSILFMSPKAKKEV